MNSETLAAVCHAAADYVNRGWTGKHEAVDRYQKAVHPTHPEAVAWSLVGSAVAAAADRFPDDEEAQETAVNRIGRALSVVCSRRCGTEREPFWTSQHFEERQGIFPSDCEQLMRDSADVVGRVEEIGGPPYEFLWWQRVSGGEE